MASLQAGPVAGNLFKVDVAGGVQVATIEVSKQHRLGLAGARQAVQLVAERLQSDLNARHDWQGDKLKFECPGAEGHINVTETGIQVSVDLSWLLKPARGRIERSINEYLDEAIG